MSPPRIAYLNPCGEVGGAERALLLLLQGLDLDRYAPIVVCPVKGRLTEMLAGQQIPSSVLPLGRAERLSRFAGKAQSAQAGAALLHAAVRMARHLRRLKPDLIHTNGIKAHVIGGMAGRLIRRPVVWHMRDLVPEGGMLRVFGAAADRLPCRILGVSEMVTAQFAGRKAAAYARTLHDAVDVARYQPRRPAPEVRAGLGFTPDQVVLAMVAHFTQWKGHHVFLDVMADLVARGLPVGGMVVGGSIYSSEGHEAYEAEVRQRCADLGLQDRVRFTGWQEHVPDFLNAADVLVHPPTRPEPFGLAIVEAMALEKPVVAAAAGGALETVEDGVTGLLVPPGDTRAFADAVAGLLPQPDRRAAMGRHGRERVARLFAPEAHVARVESVYQEVLAG